MGGGEGGYVRDGVRQVLWLIWFSGLRAGGVDNSVVFMTAFQSVKWVRGVRGSERVSVTVKWQEHGTEREDKERAWVCEGEGRAYVRSTNFAPIFRSKKAICAASPTHEFDSSGKTSHRPWRVPRKPLGSRKTDRPFSDTWEERGGGLYWRGVEVVVCRLEVCVEQHSLQRLKRL